MAALPCGCRPSDLLRRALALIDPPPAASVGGGVDLQGRGADPSVEAAAIDGAASDGDAAAIDNDGAVDKHPDESSSLGPQNKKKAVRFSPECKPPTKNVSAEDALRAYDLLVHAASAPSSSLPPHSLDGTASNGIDTSASWEGLQVIADVYRALLVASCLLLELLPREASIDGSASFDSAHEGDQSTGGTCPLDCIDDSPVVPPRCPAIEKQILSTARRCILLLRALERMCSAKAIAERHGAGGSFCPRGDDIRDYDRAAADLHANYDWHDDGALPPPCSSPDNGSSTKHSILRECLCLPIHANDPPSSRFERTAWTRPLRRGERIVSLRLKDYAYREERDECEGEAIIEETIVEDAPVEEAPVDEDEAMLNFSAAEMAREEECLLDIMLPDETTKDSNEGLTRVQKRRRGRKRRRGKGPGQSQSFATPTATGDNATAVEKAFAKEGFLLLLREKQSGIGCSQPAESTGTNPQQTVRAYAQLHPSGCLSIEDRSIRSRNNKDGKEAGEPMAHRRRYRDFWIGPQTQCTPCLPEGSSAFHFRLEGDRLLGASTLSGVHEKGCNAASGTLVDLLLSVDEGTGGSFIDGYEWVTALSGAASDAASLQTSIRSEWERDQRERAS